MSVGLCCMYVWPWTCGVGRTLYFKYKGIRKKISHKTVLPEQTFGWEVTDKREKMAARTQWMGENSWEEQKRDGKLKGTSEGLDGRAFMVYYLTCCSHVMSCGDEGMALSSFLCLFLPSSMLLSSLLSAWVENLSAAGHLASVVYSKWLCFPAWLAGSAQARLLCITQCRLTLSPNWEC